MVTALALVVGGLAARDRASPPDPSPAIEADADPPTGATAPIPTAA